MIKLHFSLKILQFGILFSLGFPFDNEYRLVKVSSTSVCVCVCYGHDRDTVTQERYTTVMIVIVSKKYLSICVASVRIANGFDDFVLSKECHWQEIAAGFVSRSSTHPIREVLITKESGSW